MKKKLLLALICFINIQCATTQQQTTQTQTIEYQQDTRPKLVVGIVVDQMRYDYLIKFYNKYGDGGFKRLMNKGYHLKNVHFNYIPTYTAVGHASIFTGTTPTNHGIISNSWYDKFEKKSVYCVEDSNYKTVGAKSGGEKSPFRMVTTTLSDQIRLAQNMRGKSIGIAIKDRSAILPAGHTANAAYWFEGGDVGKFISSTFYMDKFPQWVNTFNSSGKADAYLSQTWDTFYDINTYTESLPDNNKYEEIFKGKKTPTFPYDLAELRKHNDNYSLLKEVPFGNSITNDFAKAAILGEQLGKNEHTDFLSISYSSTDYVGHQFGVASKEIEDTYIRLDKDLESLLIFLDEEIGNNNYTLFLTADHAAVQVPTYLNDLKIPGGYFDKDALMDFANDITLANFNSTELIEDFSNYQIFLNKNKLKELNLSNHHVSQVIADELVNFENVYKTVTAHTLQTTSFNTGILQILQNGYNQKYSGDVLIVPNPATIKYGRTGSTHGSGYSYDTHVPLIFYGHGIERGQSNKYYTIIDIAPTLASLLKITNPNGCTGRTITEVLE